MVQRIVLSLVCVAALAVPAAASPITYFAYLSGPAETPPNASPGTGIAYVTIDDVTHLMEINASFQDLLGPNNAAHIHVINGPGDLNTLDTAGPVATTTPTFPGFPAGTTAGAYSQIMNMTLPGSYRAGFITDAGGIAQAEAALFLGIASGRAYFNIHTTVFTGGEIRGFLTAVPEPGTMLLLATGLGGLIRMRTRRRA